MRHTPAHKHTLIIQLLMIAAIISVLFIRCTPKLEPIKGSFMYHKLSFEDSMQIDLKADHYFWYSEHQHELECRMNDGSHHVLFKGKEFTEQRSTNSKPSWKDAILIGIGKASMFTITFKVCDCTQLKLNI